MKGPGFRLDLDVRRRWECPDCGRFVRLPGDVTQVNCTCRSDEPVAMRLVERCHKTESPFDHVGFAAQKRIDAALKKPVELPPAEEASETPAPDGDEAVSTVDRD